MATAVKFPESDDVEESLSGRYGGLPVKHVGDQNVSCWQLTEDEKEEIARTGVIWVSNTIMTRQMFERNPQHDSLQTPLSVSGHSPFPR